MKIIRDVKYGEILGAHIVGAHATELIHELAVARENEFTVEEIELGDPCAPDAQRGDRGGGARFDGAHGSTPEQRADGGRRPATLSPRAPRAPRYDFIHLCHPTSPAPRHVARHAAATLIALDLQARRRAGARFDGKLADDLLLLVEHPPVVTLGRGRRRPAHLLASGGELLAAREAWNCSKC